MAHVVGFTGIEDNGQEGMELAADETDHDRRDEDHALDRLIAGLAPPAGEHDLRCPGTEQAVETAAAPLGGLGPPRRQRGIARAGAGIGGQERPGGRGVGGATQTGLDYIPEHATDFAFASLSL